MGKRLMAGSVTDAGSSPRVLASAFNVRSIRASRRPLILLESQDGVFPAVVVNTKLPPLNRGRLSSTDRMSFVNGTAWGCDFDSRPWNDPNALAKIELIPCGINNFIQAQCRQQKHFIGWTHRERHPACSAPERKQFVIKQDARPCPWHVTQKSLRA